LILLFPTNGLKKKEEERKSFEKNIFKDRVDPPSKKLLNFFPPTTLQTPTSGLQVAV
jgi:hypothetical protein